MTILRNRRMSWLEQGRSAIGHAGYARLKGGYARGSLNASINAIRGSLALTMGRAMSGNSNRTSPHQRMISSFFRSIG